MTKHIIILASMALGAISAWGTKYTPCDEHKYPSTMTLTAQAWFKGGPVACEIAAFDPDGECRGVGVTSGDDNLAFITIQGDNDPVTLSFRIVHSAYGEEEDVLADETMSFVSNDMVGDPADPFIFNCGWRIVDGETYDENEEHADVVVTYKRHFEVDAWQALFIPVDISVEALSEFGMVAKLEGVTTSDGQQALRWGLVTDGLIEQGVPYLFKPFSEVTDLVITEAGRTLKPASHVTDETVDFNGVTYIVRGTYVEKTDMATSEAYALVDGKFKQAINDGVKLRPQRIYLNVYDSANGPISDTFDNVVGPSVGQGGIDDIISPSNADAPTYDLLGRPVANPARGLYIHGGKVVRF